MRRLLSASVVLLRGRFARVWFLALSGVRAWWAVDKSAPVAKDLVQKGGEFIFDGSCGLGVQVLVPGQVKTRSCNLAREESHKPYRAPAKTVQ